jgi:hypothetical protein
MAGFVMLMKYGGGAFCLVKEKHPADAWTEAK